MFKKKKIIIAISGGVDSSVSAWILKMKNYNVEGLFMKNWGGNNKLNNCNIYNDLIDAKLICKKLNIVLHIVDFSNEYWNNVFKDFINNYKLGYTPNPDIICNKEIKFKVFLKFAILELKADYIATGHYVNIINIKKKNILLKGFDNIKDQSYFLYTLNNKQLKKCLFPLGMLTKKYVRKIANNLKFNNANKKNSVGICFVGKYKFQIFLSYYLPQDSGFILNTKGIKIGKHNGVAYYTIGQRKGFNIFNFYRKKKGPWYVIEKKILNNLLIVSQNNKHIKLMSTGFIVKKLYLLKLKIINYRFKCKVKIQYQKNSINCIVKLKSNNKLIVIFNKVIFMIAIGQSAVFYILNFCIGGGIIKNRIF